MQAATSTAAVYVYTPVSTTTDLWSTGTDWSAVPVNSVDTELTFGATGTTFADGLTNTNTNDLAPTGTPFQLNILDLNGTGPNTGAGVININASAGSAGLSLVTSSAAATPVVNLNALAGTAGLTYNVNQPVALANNTLFTGAGTATFNFSGGISGSTVTLSKTGTSNLTLGGATTLNGLTMAAATPGGTLTVASGGSLSIGSGSTSSIGISATTGALSPATLDASLATSFTANVGSITVGSMTGSGAGTIDTINLAATNSIAASSNVTFGQGVGFATVNVNAPANSTTTFNTPTVVIGGTKSTGNFVLGTGATVNIVGAIGGTSGRSNLSIGNFSGANAGTSTSFSSKLDGSVGNLSLNLIGLTVGTVANTATSQFTGTETGTLTLNPTGTNHLDITTSNGSTANLIIGNNAQVSTTAFNGTATGTVTLANLDSTSQIVTAGAPAINLAIVSAATVGTSGVGNGNAIGTLNLVGGTLKLQSTGTNIRGDKGTSTVNFNGTRLIAGAVTSNFINGLTNAVVGTGGLIIDTSLTSQVVVPQSFTGVTNDGGFTKYGTGTLQMSGVNTYTGGTKIMAGALIANTSGALSPGAVTVASGGAFVSSNATSINYTQSFNIAGAGPGGTVLSAIRLSGGTLQTLSGGVTLSGDATIGTASATTNNITIQTNNVDLAGHTLTLGVSTLNSGIYTVASNLVSTGGGGALTIAPQAGTVLLNGTNTYTGATNVSSGTLGGTGSIAGPVIVASGATLQGGAGAATGMLTLASNLTLNSGSIIQLALGTGNAHSTLALTGAPGSTIPANQIFSFLTPQSGSYDNIITGLTSDPGTESTWTVNNAGFVGTFTYDGANIDLAFTAVPEPSTWISGLVMLGAVGLSQSGRIRRLVVR